MAYLLEQLINGLTLGAIYGLIAIGYTMVYGIVGMINFAHGEIFMVSAFICLNLYLAMGLLGITWLPLALLLVLVLAMIFTAAYGWTLERIAYRPLRMAPRLAALISAIGMSIFLQNYVQLLQGAHVKSLPALITSGFDIYFDAETFVRIGYRDVLIFIATIGLLLVFSLIISRTAIGRAQRACQQDMGMAALLGINVDRTISLTFVMGAALAAVAGLSVVLKYGVIDFFIGFLAGIKAFTAAVLGGIGSLPGAVLGGFLIGLIEVIWSAYVGDEYKDVAAFSILVLVLIFRPTGLLGRPEVEKV